MPSSDWQNGVELKESVLAEKPPEPSQTLCQQPMPRPLNLPSLCIDRECRCERWVCLSLSGSPGPPLVVMPVSSEPSCLAPDWLGSHSRLRPQIAVDYAINPPHPSEPPPKEKQGTVLDLPREQITMTFFWTLGRNKQKASSQPSSSPGEKVP